MRPDCGAALFQDEEDEKEAAAEKEKFEAIKAKIEEETERARKRAERFGQEFTEPSVELILDSDEITLYYKITRPELSRAKKETRAQYRSQVLECTDCSRWRHFTPLPHTRSQQSQLFAMKSRRYTLYELKPG